MEDILTERYSFASIVPYKDYSKLSERTKLLRSTNETFNDFQDDEDFFGEIRHKKTGSDSPLHYYQGKFVTLPEKKPKKGGVFFFTCDDPVQEKFPLQYAYVSDKKTNTWDTTDDKQIRRHYGRAFSEIVIHTIERSIRRHGDKVTIKVYVGVKQRGFNCIHFKKRFKVESITINLKTGNFITTTINKMGRSTGKTFRCNSFIFLYQMLNNGQNPFTFGNFINTNSRLYDEYQKAFNHINFTTKLQEVLGIERGHINYNSNPTAFLEDFVKVFVDKKQIKVPNGDFSFWVTRFYPTEKYLKKNGRKLIASILDAYGLKSKSTIRLLHEHPNLDFGGFVKFCSYFGKDYAKYIGNLSERSVQNSYRKSTNSWNDWMMRSNLKYENRSVYFLTDVEKENLIKIANSFEYTESSGIMTDRYIQLFDDHFNMINKVKDYDPEISMRARTLKEFNEEHRELSKIISAIKKGWVVEYQYDKKTLDEIEKPLECLYDEQSLHFLYPTILKREEEYIEEGAFMHHCVASYSNKDKSMIISVRNEDGSDRVTCEFDIQTGRCIQKRSFCNAEPPKHFQNGLEILEGQVIKLARWGILNWKEKKKVPIKINGVEIPMDAIPVNARDLFNVQLPF